MLDEISGSIGGMIEAAKAAAARTGTVGAITREVEIVLYEDGFECRGRIVVGIEERGHTVRVSFREFWERPETLIRAVRALDQSLGEG